MWSEGDNYDLALSFQEKAGCDEIWEKICQVGSFFDSLNTRVLICKNLGYEMSCLYNRTLLKSERCICLVFNKSIAYPQTLTKSLNVTSVSENQVS